MDFDIKERLVIGGLIMFTVLMVVFCIWAANQADKNCTAKGGHTHNATGIGINPANGQPVTTTSTQCLTSDGRVIE